MTKAELLESITCTWCGSDRHYEVSMAGKVVFCTDDNFQCCLFIAALKAQVLTQP